MELTELQQAAYDGLNDFAGGGLVFLLEGAVGAASAGAPNGSGTLLRTPGGRIFVLTARHVLEDDAEGNARPFDVAQAVEYALGGRAVQYGVADALGEQFWHPAVDAAIALLKPDAANKFAHAALSCDVVAATDEEDPEGPMTIICGFPALYRRAAVDHQNKRVDVGFASITYSTDVNGKDERGRYRVTWAEGELSRAVPLRAQSLVKRFGIEEGQVFDLAHPGGISGGPLWRFRKVPKAEIWDPSKLGRLIGVASVFLRPPDNIELCPSVATWGDWFRETVAKIDAGASNV